MSNLWVKPEELGADLSSSEYAYEACKTASHLLWGMSGRKFSGTTSIVEHYAPANHPIDPRAYYLDYPQSTSAFFAGPSGIPVNTRIRLRGQPVQNITSVANAEGDVYSGDEYYLVDHKYLQFTTVVSGSVVVSYTYGSMPPIAGRMAARRLAREFALLWSGSSDCALPDRVTSVSRDGVSYTILDNQDFIAELRTGIYEVDLFIKTINPDGARKRSRVLSPDTRRGRRGAPTTTDAGSDAWVVISPTGGTSG